MENENMMQIYKRTYKNCVFYKENGNNAALLNEIGVLRGIVYCIESVIGHKNAFELMCDKKFAELISEQQRLKEILT